MPDTTAIALSRPVTVHDEAVSTLTMREPVGRDMVAAGSGQDPMFATRLAASCCGVPPSVLLDMFALDFNAVLGALNAFLAPPSIDAPSTPSSTSPSSGAA